MKTTIIDSNNLIHKVPHLKLLFIKDKEAAMVSLVETVKSRMNKTDKIIFVFDGVSDLRNKDVTFSNNLSADEVIRNKIENFKDHRKLKIISSDTGITGLAKVCGCEVQRSEDFWNKINKVKSISTGKNINQNYIYDKKEKPDRMNKKEIEEFRQYFT